MDLEPAQYILAGLAKQEDMIFRRRRRDGEDRREANAKRRKLQQAWHGRGGNQDSSPISKMPQATADP